MIIPLQWAIHMNEKTWINPEEFKPERFLSESNSYVQPKDFIPFQTGKRMCLGDELAKQLLYLFAGHLIHNYDLSVVDGDKINMNGICGITLTPPEYELIFKKRK